jgi:hypothetical protein
MIFQHKSHNLSTANIFVNKYALFIFLSSFLTQKIFTANWLSNHVMINCIASLHQHQLWNADKIHTASHMYVQILSLCHSTPLQFTWRVTNVNFQRILFLCTLLTTFHLREMN